jgi:hypothetical protein
MESPQAIHVGQILMSLPCFSGHIEHHLEIAGSRTENFVDLATMVADTRGDPVKIKGVSDPSNPDAAI